MPKAKTAKKRVTKKKAAIKQAPQDKVFFLIDGRTLRDIKELADSLDEMADHVYYHHVTEERNDFAQWIHDVFKDAELAEKLRESTGKHHSQIIIYRRILGSV